MLEKILNEEYNELIEKNNNSSSSTTSLIATPSEIGLIEPQIQTLENAIKHLQRSNKEIEEFIEEEKQEFLNSKIQILNIHQQKEENKNNNSIHLNQEYVPDQDFIDAIQENLIAIKKKQEQIEKLKRDLFIGRNASSEGHYL